MRSIVGLGSIIAMFAVASAQAAVPAASPVGLWLNPHNSVAVKTGPCGAKLCGWIAWASREAIADARDSGVQNLVGTALLENYALAGRNRWTGTVYVPDMGHRFYSQIEQVNPGTLQVKGCLLGGLICKSQMWTHIDSLPAAT